MNSKNTRILLEDLKRQLASVNHYLDHTKIIENDRRSVTNVGNIKQILGNISYKLNKHLNEVEQDIRVESDASIDKSYKTSLATVNSPTKTMIAAAEKNNLAKQSVFGLKNNLVKEAMMGLSKRNLVKEASDSKKLIIEAMKNLHEKDFVKNSVNRQRAIVHEKEDTEK